ncbi:MAG TPA: hypothetical protein PLW09_16460, partial [Candidatus Kapabacteria bacterium]|nr:hypothetical protein [Candidatus Kapabacteria bacterium]
MKSIFYALCFCVAISQVFAQTDYKWQESGSLILARQRFNVALLPNNEVLIIGGMLQNGTITNTTEIYNPITRQTRQGTPMNQPHGECDVITRSDGSIIVVSGVSNYSSQQVTKAVELYNPATQEWRVIGSLLEGRRQHSAIALSNDEILVVGGRDQQLNTYNSSEIFTISTGKSRYVGSLPNVVNNARISRSANNSIVLFGGREYGNGSNQSNNVYSYDTLTGGWKSVGKIPQTTAYPAITRLNDGRIISMGGKYEPTLSFLKQIFIENNNTFTTFATMKTERHLGYIHQLTPSVLLAFGGRNNDGSNMVSGEFVDIETKQVTTASPMNEAHTEGCSIEIPFLSNNTVYRKQIIVMSGIGSNGQYTPSIESMIISTQGIEGIINIYTPVTGIGTDCNATITVADNKGFSVGDKVLIIQMQGAEIVPDNTEQYGKVIDYRSTGNHEFSRITSITNRIIGLESQLLHSYDITKKVQMIRVPEYQSIVVSNTLTAKEWDGSTGGVLVFDVKDTLELNANLNVTGKGFRGGKAISSQDFPWNYVTDYIVNVNKPGYAAAKGEGIAGYGIASMTNGRGSAANGGGGGGNHNAGGAGGANYGSGGNGGYGWQSTNYSGNNEEAQGLGGKPIDYESFTSSYVPLMMGGGGGAGHTNQTTVGNGQVIVSWTVPTSESFTTTGTHTYTVPAGVTRILVETWGGGGSPSNTGVEKGGGGGGAIYIDAKTIASKLACSASGGKGGDIRLEKYATPPGGGGGSGLVTFTNRVPSSMIEANIKAGIAGISVYQSDNYGA